MLYQDVLVELPSNAVTRSVQYALVTGSYLAANIPLQRDNIPLQGIFH
jgi:hypothetical protein